MKKPSYQLTLEPLERRDAPSATPLAPLAMRVPDAAEVAETRYIETLIADVRSHGGLKYSSEHPPLDWQKCIKEGVDHGEMMVADGVLSPKELATLQKSSNESEGGAEGGKTEEDEAMKNLLEREKDARDEFFKRLGEVPENGVELREVEAKEEPREPRDAEKADPPSITRWQMILTQERLDREDMELFGVKDEEGLEQIRECMRQAQEFQHHQLREALHEALRHQNGTHEAPAQGQEHQAQPPVEQKKDPAPVEQKKDDKNSDDQSQAFKAFGDAWASFGKEEDFFPVYQKQTLQSSLRPPQISVDDRGTAMGAVMATAVGYTIGMDRPTRPEPPVPARTPEKPKQKEEKKSLWSRALSWVRGK